MVLLKISPILAETLKRFYIMTNSNNYCVIMGGGIGSRFWPYSRKNLPKQFLDFFGTGRSLIQQTFDRYKKIVPIENIFITTNVLYKELVQEQTPRIGQITNFIGTHSQKHCSMYSLGFLSHKKIQSKCQCHCRTVRPSDFKRR